MQNIRYEISELTQRDLQDLTLMLNNEWPLGRKEINSDLLNAQHEANNISKWSKNLCKAYDKNRLVGFIGLCFGKSIGKNAEWLKLPPCKEKEIEEEKWPHELLKFNHEISYFIVDREYRGRGIGKHLFKWALSQVPKGEYLEWWSSDGCNMDFYRHIKGVEEKFVGYTKHKEKTQVFSYRVQNN